MNLKTITQTLALVIALTSALHIVKATDAKPEIHNPKKTSKLGTIYEVAELDKAPSPKVKVFPSYPYDLKKRNVPGKVTCELIINAEGEVASIITKEANHPAFTDAAKQAFKKWKYRPGQKDGHPVACRVLESVDFVSP